MLTHLYKKSDGDSPDKMQVFQDCLAGFNALPVNPKQCRGLLARLLRLLYTGAPFPAAELTTLFFSILKLFQHPDASLRQLVYLALKELCAVSDDILMVTSSIMKDVQGDSVFRPNAIRTLARVLDGSTVNAAERLMKTAVVDRNPAVSLAALVSSYHLLAVAPDVVKRWANETAESLSAAKAFPASQYALHDYYGLNALPQTLYTYQYHALGLLYHLRSHDRVLLMKLIGLLSLSSLPLRLPLAVVQLIRFVGDLVAADPSTLPELYPLLAAYLRHKLDMVELEAAKTIVGLKGLTSEQFAAAVSCFQVLLLVPRTALRFGAVRALNRIAMVAPERVLVCVPELEALVNDPLRAVSTYAVTTLLKAGTPENVDRLVRTIHRFVPDMADEFKVVVVDAVRTLALRFPDKYKPVLRFLNDMLRDDGGFGFKLALVDALVDLVRFVPAAREPALAHLCDFIEDCDHTELAVRVLHLLGAEGPRQPTPTLYIRHVYNRVVLENLVVRLAAVVALSKFGLLPDEAIRSNVVVLLTRCLNDPDDEVRDRAALLLKLIGSDPTAAALFLAPQFQFLLPVLEAQLAKYVSSGREAFATPFDMSLVPQVLDEELRLEALRAKVEASEEPAQEEVQDKTLAHALELAAIPEIAEFGTVLHSSSEVLLTDRDTEFVVRCVKHVFDNHLVLQFNVENTLDGILLADVGITVEPDSEGYVEEFSTPVDELGPHAKGTVYVAFARPAEVEELGAEFGATLVCTTKDVDETGAADEDGFEDLYELEPVVVDGLDFVAPAFTSAFAQMFDGLPHRAQGTFQLAGDVVAAVRTVAGELGMMALEGSDVVETSVGHELKVYGKSVWGGKVGAVVRFVGGDKGVTLKAVVGADEEGLAELVLSAVH